MNNDSNVLKHDVDNTVEWLPFPFEINDLDTKTNEELLKHFTGEKTGFVQVGTKKWFFPSSYKDHAENYFNFQPRPNDVWIVTFPRSGTTWTQELIWLLANNLNYKKAHQTPLAERFPFLEWNSFFHPSIKQMFLEENSFSEERCSFINNLTAPKYKSLEQSTERRFIKTHLPLELLSPNLLKVGCKVIYVARNPKDVAVSFYHLNKMFRNHGYSGSFSQYWHYFKQNLQPWAPYWSHITDAWKSKNNENFLFMFYENMNKNLGQSIKTVAEFLNVNYTEDDYKTLEKHLQIDNFKHNKSVNFDGLKDLGILLKAEACFVRSGKNGGWKNYFDDELTHDANKWIDKNLENTSLLFPD